MGKNQRGNTAQSIRFQGQWHDEESGHNRHRYYDPKQGRHISQDPIGLKGGSNLNGYVTNPKSTVDPLVVFTTKMLINYRLGIDLLSHAVNVLVR